MKIKRGSVTPPAPIAPGDDTPPTPPAPAAARVRPLVAPRAPSSSKKQAKILLNTLDGKVDWEKMSPEAKKAFEDLFKNPEFLRQFGLPAKRSFEPKQMKALYDGMSMVYRTVCGLVLRWPPAALALLGYTAEEKEMLAEPTANLLDRWAPKLISENKELLIFLAIFGAVTQKKFIEASMVVNDAKRKQPGPVRLPASPGPRMVERKPPQETPTAPIAPEETLAPAIELGVGPIPTDPNSLDDFGTAAGEIEAQEFSRTLG